MSDEPNYIQGWKHGKPVLVWQWLIGRGFFMHRPAALDFLRMAAAIKRDLGVDIIPLINRAFATNAQQKRLYDLFKAGKGNRAARPRYSNHQDGTAVDLDRGRYDKTDDGVPNGILDLWFDEHLHEYNFVRDVGGEPWHLHWVGEDQPKPYAATKAG